MYNIILYTHTHFVRWCTSTERLCTNCVCGVAAGLNAPVQNEPKVTVHLPQTVNTIRAPEHYNTDRFLILT